MSFLSLRPNAISCPRLMAMGFSESDVISVLQKIFTTQDPRIHLGIGDDAAVVATSPPPTPISTTGIPDSISIIWPIALGNCIVAAVDIVSAPSAISNDFVSGRRMDNTFVNGGG